MRGSASAPSGSGSIGDRAVRQVADEWMVSGERVQWVENGFDWRPGSFRVAVRCSRASQPEFEDVWRLSVATDFVDAVTITNSRVRLLAAMARFSPTYSLVYQPAAASSEANAPTDLHLFSSVYVGAEQLDWLPQFLARMAVMQPINAEIQAELQAKQFGGKVAHGESGKARRPEKILDAARTLYAPAGEAPSRWRGTDEFTELAAEIDNGADIMAAARDNALTVAALVGVEPSLILLRPDGRHPQLGNGLLVIVQLPYHYTEDEAAQRSAQLNFEEATGWTGFPQLGSWHPHQADDGRINLAHTSFVPNALARPNMAGYLAYWSLDRARWGCTLAESWAGPTLQ